MLNIAIGYMLQLVFPRGARHGLKQSGKLKRLEEQEKQMTETISHVT